MARSSSERARRPPHPGPQTEGPASPSCPSSSPGASNTSRQIVTSSKRSEWHTSAGPRRAMSSRRRRRAPLAPRARRALGHDAPDPQVEGNGAATAARRADSKGRELGRREGGPEEDAGAPFGNRSPGRLPPIRRSSPTGPPSERVPTSDAARAHPARDISGRSPPG